MKTSHLKLEILPTKMQQIQDLQSLDSTSGWPNAQFVFPYPDKDILVQVKANCGLLLKNTAISMASGVVQIEPLWRALCKERAKTLPAFHAFTGVDNTGRFSCIGKAT